MKNKTIHGAFEDSRGVIVADPIHTTVHYDVKTLHQEEPTMKESWPQVDVGFYLGIATYNKVLSYHCDGIMIELGRLGLTGAFIRHPEEAHFTVSLAHERYPEADFFMSHGLADKRWRDADQLSGFTYVMVSGPAWVNKLVRQGRSKDSILVVGYPYLDPVFVDRPPRDHELVYWCPTHQAIQEVSSYGRLEIEELSYRFKLVSIPHPAISGSGMTTLDQFRKFLPGVVIADSGSVIYEAWSLGIPVVFPDWLVKEGVHKRFNGSFEDEIYSNRIGWHAESMEDMIDLLDDLTGSKSGKMGPWAKEFIEEIFPSRLRGCSSRHAAKQIEHVLGDWR